MDLQLYLRVMWRFRALMISGFVLALLLVFLAVVRVSFVHGKPQLAYRQSEQWVSYGRIFVTLRGFEWGSSILGGITNANTAEAANRIGAERAEEDRLTTLAILYSNFADSDPVRKIMLRAGPIHGQIQSAPLPVTPDGSQVLPIISIAGIADSAFGARALAQRGTDSLISYISGQQVAAEIPKDQRIQLEVVQEAGKAKLLKGRSKTLPAVIFLTIMIACFGLALVLENLRPRSRQLVAAESVRPVADAARRSASL